MTVMSLLAGAVLGAPGSLVLRGWRAPSRYLHSTGWRKKVSIPTPVPCSNPRCPFSPKASAGLSWLEEQLPARRFACYWFFQLLLHCLYAVRQALASSNICALAHLLQEHLKPLSNEVRPMTTACADESLVLVHDLDKPRKRARFELLAAPLLHTPSP